MQEFEAPTASSSSAPGRACSSAAAPAAKTAAVAVARTRLAEARPTSLPKRPATLSPLPARRCRRVVKIASNPFLPAGAKAEAGGETGAQVFTGAIDVSDQKHQQYSMLISRLGQLLLPPFKCHAYVVHAVAIPMFRLVGTHGDCGTRNGNGFSEAATWRRTFSAIFLRARRSGPIISLQPPSPPALSLSPTENPRARGLSRALAAGWNDENPGVGTSPGGGSDGRTAGALRPTFFSAAPDHPAPRAIAKRHCTATSLAAQQTIV